MLRSIFRSQRMPSLYRRFISLLANQKLVAEVGVEPTIAFAVVMSHASVPRLVPAVLLNFKEPN